MKKNIYLNLLLLFVLVAFSSSVFSIDLDTSSNIHYFSIDDLNKDSTTWIDQSPNSNNGSRTSTITNISAILNEGDNFTINNQKITFTEQTLNQWTWGCTINYFSQSENYILLVGGTSPNYIGFNGVVGKFVLRNNNVSETQFSLFNVPPVNTWVSILVRYDGLEYEAFENGVSKGTVAGIGHLQKFSTYGDVIGATYDYKGALDECFLYNFSVTDSQVLELYNSGNLFNPYNVNITTPSSNLNTFFKNESGFTKTSFEEGENFFSFINWSRTSDGSALNKSVGNCSITLKNGIFENESLTENFLLCNHVSCNFTSIKENFFLEESLNAQEDQIRVSACHPQLQSGDLEVLIECGLNSSSQSISSGSFPLCTSGFGTALLTTDVCLNYDNINVTLEFSGNLGSRKLINMYEVDREFSQHIINSDDLSFNSSSGFWESTHYHEYYDHGTKQINTSCVSTDPNLNNNFNTTITITNIPPLITGGPVQTNQGLFNINLGESVLYGSGNFTFFGSVVDDDLDYVNFSFYNSSNIIIYSLEINNVSFLKELNISSDIFRDINNPFNVSVWANDSFGDSSFTSIVFNVSGLPFPVCTGLNSQEVFNNTNVSLNVSCTDESFFSFNLSCSNGQSNFSSGLNVQTFNYFNEFLITSPVICNYKYCDGHTVDDLSIFFIDKVVEKSVIVSKMDLKNEFIPITDKDLVSVVTTLETDRLSFTYTYPKEILKVLTKKSFYYVTSPNSYYLPSEKYKGWIVDYDSETWFDANLKNDVYSNVIVKRVNLTHWLIDIWSYETVLEFESIGELNCVENSLLINSIIAPPPPELITEFNSVPQALFWGMILLFWVVFLVMTFTIKGKSGRPVQFFNFLQLFFGIVFGLGFLHFSQIIGISVLGFCCAIAYGVVRDG